MRAAVAQDHYRLQPGGQAYYVSNHAQDPHVTFGPEHFGVRPRKADAQQRWAFA
jgi:hypothetical protein